MDRRSLILIANIGGTNARFACAQHKPEGGWEVLDYKKLQGKDYASFGAALAHYIGGGRASSKARCLLRGRPD